MPQRPPARRIVAENIRRAAQSKGLNQTALGAAIGVNQSQFSRRLLGRVAFSIDELDTLAHVLDVPLSELISAAPAAS